MVMSDVNVRRSWGEGTGNSVLFFELSANLELSLWKPSWGCNTNPKEAIISNTWQYINQKICSVGGQLWAQWVLEGMRNDWGFEQSGNFTLEARTCTLKGSVEMVVGQRGRRRYGTGETKVQGRDADGLGGVYWSGWLNVCAFCWRSYESWAAVGKTDSRASVRPGRVVVT